MGIRLLHILVLFGFIATPFPENNCIPEAALVSDFKDYFGLNDYITDVDVETVELLVKTEHDKLLFAPVSCGSAGCEYALYVKTGRACYQRVFDFRGAFKITKEYLHEFPIIEVHHKDGYLSTMTITKYGYSPADKYYIRLD